MSSTLDYQNRQGKTYDAKQVLKSAATQAVGTEAAGAGSNNEIHVGENALLEAILQVRGAIGAGATLDVKIQESDSEGGAYSDIPGGAFIQITDASVTEDRISFRTTKAWISVESVAAVGTMADSEAYIVGASPS